MIRGKLRSGSLAGAPAVLLGLALGGMALGSSAVARLDVPAGFERIEDAAFVGSLALIPRLSPGADRRVVAAWADLDGEASLVLGKVEAPLVLGREPANEIASAIAGHLRGELDLPTTVEAAERKTGSPARHWEARAATRAGEGARTVRFAFYPAGASHYVIAASYACEHEQSMASRLDPLFAQFDPPAEAGAGTSSSMRLVGAGLACLLSALGITVALSRRRRAVPGGDEDTAS